MERWSTEVWSCTVRREETKSIEVERRSTEVWICMIRRRRHKVERVREGVQKCVYVRLGEGDIKKRGGQMEHRSVDIYCSEKET